ncbi:hypothetical protein MTO96_004114 [Rhipicephalus appendiculatus]
MRLWTPPTAVIELQRQTSATDIKERQEVCECTCASTVVKLKEQLSEHQVRIRQLGIDLEGRAEEVKCASASAARVPELVMQLSLLQVRVKQLESDLEARTKEVQSAKDMLYKAQRECEIVGMENKKLDQQKSRRFSIECFKDSPEDLIFLAVIACAMSQVLVYPGGGGYVEQPQPYHFSYDSVNPVEGAHHYHEETSDATNSRTGSYGYTDANGITRRVDYVADAGGFRATVTTNEPGTAASAPRRRALQLTLLPLN